MIALPDRPHSVADSLLEVERLRVFTHSGGATKTITTGINLKIARGETVGIVGESGSGKSLTARAIMRLLPQGVHATGRVLFQDTDLLTASEATLRRIRGRRLSMMFQDPFTMLNPLLRCGRHIEEVVSDHDNIRGRRSLETEVVRRLAEVGINDAEVAARYPFQLSGGMRQRVALASALARDPDLLIADEPSTALDVTTQAQILALIKSVQERRGMGLVLITHDLRVAFSTCDRIYVLYAGSLLEVGASRDVEREPLHPYTLGLLLSEPSPDTRMRELVVIKGSVPAADDVAGECSFVPRCFWSTEVCRDGDPPLVDAGDGRMTACVRIHEIREEMGTLRMRAQASGGETGATKNGEATLVSVRDVTKTFIAGRRSSVEALKNVSIEIGPGESVGLVGESGSGKTTLGRCIVGLETPQAGSIEIDGIDASDFAAMAPADRRRVRHVAQMVFQDPYSTLNPRHSVARCLRESLRVVDGKSAGDRNEVEELLSRVGLPASYARRKPAALSGGERQRVAIARALAVRPQLLVCDEPVSALDVSVQAQILNLFKDLQRGSGISYLFISHDLSVVRQVADRLYVLYRGEVVESGPAGEVLASPQHPYTRQLIASIPGSERFGTAGSHGAR